MRINEEQYKKLLDGTLPVEAWMVQDKIPGATVAVIRAGEVTFSKAYGVRDAYGAPMQEGVLFECASLTKSLFALLAMQEVDAGKIDLDEPIMKRLQDKPWSDDPRFGSITPRQALSHGTGLPNWEAKPMHMLFDPGTQYSYSGEGYFLLQRLVEQIEGKNMNELFKERFFGCFGMESSTAYWTPAVGAAFAQGFGRDGKVRKVRGSRRTSGNAPEPNAAWSLYSYAADYARFICGMIREHGGLSDKVFAEMTSPQNRADDNINWGLGFGIPAKEPNVLWHWGDNDGFKSFSVWDKVTGDGAVVTTNSDFGMDFYMDLLKQLTDGEFYDDVRAFIDNAE